eukprot:5856492-Amphidinium_carterae.1
MRPLKGRLAVLVKTANAMNCRRDHLSLVYTGATTGRSEKHAIPSKWSSTEWHTPRHTSITDHSEETLLISNNISFSS